MLWYKPRASAEGRKRGLPIVGLETLEGQLRMLAAIPDAQQIAMLKAVLFYADRTDDQMETMLQLYLKRQMGFAIPFQQELARRAGIEPGAYEAFESEIIVRRNADMAKAAAPLLEKGAAFFGGALFMWRARERRDMTSPPPEFRCSDSKARGQSGSRTRLSRHFRALGTGSGSRAPASFLQLPYRKAACATPPPSPCRRPK